MPTPDPCRGWAPLLAAAAVEDLTGSERVSLDGHLDGCAACRGNLAELRRTLAVLPAADVDHLDHPSGVPTGLDRRIFDTITRNARTRRHAVIISVTGVAAGVLVLLYLAFAFTGGGASTGERVQLADAGGVHAVATLEPRPWGTQIRLQIDGFAPATTCNVWLERPNGTRVPAGTFTSLRQRPLDVVLATSLPRDQAVAVGVTSTEGEELRAVLH